VQLTVIERFRLLGILPTQGDFATLKIVRKLRETLSLSEEENERFGMQRIEVDGQPAFKWDDKVPQEAEIEISAMGRNIIVSKLAELSSSKKLTEDLLTVYEKFVEADGG
jgi:hypothetical protein